MPTKYALVNPSDVVDRFAFDIDPSVQTKTGWRWLPVTTTNPEYDSEAQTRDGPVVTVLASSVTEVWTVRSKTAAELDAAKDRMFDGTAIIVRKILFDMDKRLRTLEGQPQRTAAQFKTYAKAL